MEERDRLRAVDGQSEGGQTNDRPCCKGAGTWPFISFFLDGERDHRPLGRNKRTPDSFFVFQRATLCHFNHSAPLPLR